MSTDVKGANTPDADGATPAADDPIKNLKGEFGRKFGNLEEQTKHLSSQIQQIVNALNKPTSSPASTPEKKVSVFDDEEAYARSIEERAEARITAKLAEQEAIKAKYATVSTQLVTEFPELNDAKSPLMGRAQEIYLSLPEEERRHHLAMKAAVTEAAAELGMKPKSKRTASEGDDFTLGGSSQASRPSKKSSDELNPATVKLAELMGLDVNDPKVMDRLKQRAKRKNWSKYE